MAIDSTARAAGTPSAAAATGAGDARWEVQVASYRIAADPGRFSVRAHGGRVDVVVKSGKLAVWSSRRLLATIVAGERWTNLTTDEAAPGDAPNAAIDSPATREEVPAPEAAPAGAEVPDCTRLTRQGAIDPALACFARQSAQPGLTGELALIELARIRRDVKGDLAGAEQALAEHRRRFPRGALAAEATGSRVELLLRLGRAGEALDESDHLNGSESLFWRAVCLAKLGRKTAAAQAFDDYLARTDGKRRSEATRMRDDLGPR
jgi:hypothetical protein